jgi:hypothetical protein
MGNVLSVVFPSLTVFTTLDISEHTNSIPYQVTQPLGSMFRICGLFWSRTNECVGDTSQELGDKCAPSNFGKILTGYRLDLVVASHLEMAYTAWVAADNSIG